MFLVSTLPIAALLIFDEPDDRKDVGHEHRLIDCTEVTLTYQAGGIERAGHFEGCIAEEPGFPAIVHQPAVITD